MSGATLRATAFSGEGRGAAFTELSWVQAGVERLVGFRPHPGTLNLRLEAEEDRAAWARVRARGGLLLPPGEEGFCEGRLFPCRLRRATGEGAWHEAAAVWPRVPGYPADERLELLAPVSLRDALGIGEGDAVEVAFGPR